MAMKTKNMKVYQGSGRNYVEVPKIVLQGKWLQDLGFSVGDQLTVTCSEDMITIKRSSDIQNVKSAEMKEGSCAGCA